MANYGIKITAPGASITSTDIRDYTLWSKYNTTKTYAVVTGGLSFANEADTEKDHNLFIFTHNLGYQPLFVWYWELVTNGTYGSDFWIGVTNSGGGLNSQSVIARADSSIVAVDYRYTLFGGDGHTNISSFQFNVKAYVFIDVGS